MKIALIADIHANLTSLDAVLADIQAQNVDRVVCLGDVAATGPQPLETLARLRELQCPVVMGNADAWLLAPRPSSDPDEETARIEAIDVWCAEQLTGDDMAYIRTFQPRVELSFGDGRSILCFHGSPGSYDDRILATTPDEELERMLAGAHATVMAGGHTHVPMLRRYQDMLVINPGSVGLPYELLASSGRVRNPPWAEYALISWSDADLGIELRRLPVDLHAVVGAILGSGMPYGEWWAKDWG